MTLSVIIPAHNHSDWLGQCLEALVRSSRAPDEIIVVDDASSEDVAAVARAWGARVLVLTGKPLGPAAARNRGAALAQGDLLFFVDADVRVYKDTVERALACLEQHPQLAALFGSYDDDPPERNVASLYKNLLHHHVHQRAAGPAETFWAGCGLIRREAFQAANGFDESFQRPAIEDIDLGARLRAQGMSIRLCPTVQVQHLKRWTVASLIITDIRQRAIPWSRLIALQGRLPATLNLDPGSRCGAVLAWLALALSVAGFWRPWLWLMALLALSGLAALNAGLLRLLRRRGGWRLLFGGAALHWLYLLYSSAVFAVVAGPRLALKRVVGLLGLR
ncbi:MAG: glycosyltransferase family 2 protein [Anaerolineae bacterium]